MATERRPLGGNSLVALPDSYVAVDVETTGLSFEYCDLIEVGALKVEHGKVVDTFESLIHLDYELPFFITMLTGITDEMLADAPSEGTVIRAFSEFAGDSVSLC